MIDTHLHVVNFLQQPMRTCEALKALELAGDGLVVFGLPVKKKWGITEPEKPTYYLDDNAPCGSYSLTDVLVADLVGSLPEDHRADVAPLICGFDPTDQLATDHIELMWERSDAWRGIGEILLRHDDLTEITYGENARAGHPALDGVLELCASRGWPFTFHQDTSSAGRCGQHEYVDEVRHMLGKHPDVSFVWAHAGASRRIQPDDHTAMMDDLLAAHPNLHIDLSWVILDRIVDASGAVDPAWVSLLSRYPDRFVLGSDAFGSLDEVGETLKARERLLVAVDTTANALIAAGNARRLWWGR